MMNEITNLSKNELKIMNYLWEMRTDMNSSDIAKEFSNWKSNGYIHALLKGLENKGYIKCIDKIHISTRNSKIYRVMITKEEHAASIIRPFNFDRESIPKLAMALLDKDSTNDDLIEQLENMIDELKKERR